MANQTRQLAELLEREGARVTHRANQRPLSTAIHRVHSRRARTVPARAVRVRLWRVAGQVEIVHVMANSGWSWHLCAAPAMWIAHWRHVPAVVNYRGGEAGSFP